MPGSTPTAVPSVVPARPQSRFDGVSATAKPASRSLIRRRRARQRHAEAAGEHDEQDDGEHRADGEIDRDQCASGGPLSAQRSRGDGEQQRRRGDESERHEHDRQDQQRRRRSPPTIRVPARSNAGRRSNVLISVSAERAEEDQRRSASGSVDGVSVTDSVAPACGVRSRSSRCSTASMRDCSDEQELAKRPGRSGTDRPSRSARASPATARSWRVVVMRARQRVLLGVRQPGRRHDRPPVGQIERDAGFAQRRRVDAGSRATAPTPRARAADRRRSVRRTPHSR